MKQDTYIFQNNDYKPYKLHLTLSKYKKFWKLISQILSVAAASIYIRIKQFQNHPNVPMFEFNSGFNTYVMV